MFEWATDLTQRVFGRTSLLAFLFGTAGSIVITVAIGVFGGGVTFRNNWPYVSDPAWRTVLPLLFIIILFSLFVALYFLLQRDTDDLISPTRRQLRGSWVVQYQDYRYDLHGNIEQVQIHQDATIGIGELGKLFIRFDLRDVKPMANFVKIITDIAINISTNPKRMIYYDYWTVPTVNERNEKVGEVSGKFFAVLEILTTGEGATKPDLLDGKWYDLDGDFTDFKIRVQTADKSRFLPDVNFGTLERLPQVGTVQFVRRPRIRGT